MNQFRAAFPGCALTMRDIRRWNLVAACGIILMLASVVAAQERLPAVDEPAPLFENPPLLYDSVQPATYPSDPSQPLFEDYAGGEPVVDEQLFAEADAGYIVPQEYSHIS